MLTIRHAQITALQMPEERIYQRALQHLRNCIPDTCAVSTEEELIEIIRWGRRRSQAYGIKREYDFFRYLNLMFLFGFEFDTNPRHSWAARVLNDPNLRAAAKIELVMDHAMLACSAQRHQER